MRTFICIFLIFLVEIYSQATDNTDICLKSNISKPFDLSWCQKLTRTEGCRLGIMNLLFAASAGDTASLRKYKSEGMDMTLADYDARYAIHLAAAEGHLEAVKFLIEEAKVPASPKDRWGNTPMDEAVRFNKNNIVEYLKTVKG